jgi:putative membrane protein
VLLAWLLSALALLGAAWIVPGADVKNFGSALLAAAVIAALNAILPPAIAALRLPFIAALGFLVLLVVDALMLLAADAITDGDLTIDSLLVCAWRRPRRRGDRRRAPHRRRHQRRRHLHVQGDRAHRPPLG